MTERHSITRLGTIRGAGRPTREHAERPAPGWPTVILRVAGSGLLIATAAIHLDLYLTGYRTIPTIGWLFLLQVIAAFALGLAVLVIPGRLVIPSRLAAAAGAGFALATLGGYLLSVWTGLFGFTEVRTGAGIAAGLVEVAAFVVLAALALAPAPASAPAGGAGAAPGALPGPAPPRGRRGGRNARRGPGGRGPGAARAGGGRSQPGGTSGHGDGPEDHDDRRDHGTDQRQGLHALLVRPRHPDRIQVLRQLRRVLAPGDRHRRSQPGRAGPDRHDQANR